MTPSDSGVPGLRLIGLGWDQTSSRLPAWGGTVLTKGGGYRVVAARVFPMKAFVSGSALSHSLGYASFM